MMVTLRELKHHAIASSLFPPTTLGRAIRKLGFVQADPIRAPARAQDLILRHRVKEYLAEDLDRKYRSLQLEEDFLYAYGFMPLETWRLLHPRVQRALSAGEQKVLDLVSHHKRLHPRELEASLGRERETNAWGGYSKATTRNLERLHYLGLIRIAGREKGIRLYQRATLQKHSLDNEERLLQLALLIARILAPLPRTVLAPLCGILDIPPHTCLEGPASLPNCCNPANWRVLKWTAFVISGRPAGSPAASRSRWCASWLRSIPWYGTAPASSTSGAGPIVLRHTPRPPSESWDITPCPCSGGRR